jgi:3-oxoacyl-[acyl-carrier protein] reductase
MDLNLLGKKALITGGNHGIGLAIKKSLEKEGVKVISLSRSEGIDLMDNERLSTIDFSNVDILINNIGGMGTCDYMNSWLCMKKNYGITNIFTEWFLTKNPKWGRVITISSIYGKERGNNPWFTATKAAQIAYMKSLSGDPKYRNKITFNTVCPGCINTKPEIKNYAEKYYMSLGKSEDVANIVIFLCSDLAKHINGATITCDGGDSHAF